MASEANVSPTPEMEETARRLKEAQTIAVLTGAGVSAESGIPTFRGEEGLWHKYRAEELANPEAFARDPKLVWEWYDWRRGIVGEARPNPAHETLARWGERFPLSLITQNIDGLHRAAGSRDFIELHGCIWRVRCTGCRGIFDHTTHPLPEIPPRCEECGEIVRPDIVWFGETLPPDALEGAVRQSQQCDLFFALGTSSVVQPAASLPLLAKQMGACVVEVNPEETPISHVADLVLRGPAGEVLPAVDALLGD
jgi:NAD-dependent deacetylase